jgi:hypothetical protein
LERRGRSVLRQDLERCAEVRNPTNLVLNLGGLRVSSRCVV